MRTLCSTLLPLVCFPVALLAYSKDSDSGLVFSEARLTWEQAHSAGASTHVKRALLVSPDDLPKEKHYSNSSMAHVELIEIAAGGKVGAYTVERDAVEQVFIVLQGRVEFTIDGQLTPVTVDEVLFVPAGVERSLRVIGEEAAKIVRAEWREVGATANEDRKAVVVSEQRRQLARTGGEGYLTISPNPRQEKNPLSIISYGAAHINASNSLLLYSEDISGARPFTANTRFARMGLSQYHPGGGTRWHFHADREQCFVILSGAALVEIGANTVEVKRGDILFAPRHVGHGYMATGTQDFKFFELEWGRN